MSRTSKIFLSFLVSAGLVTAQEVGFFKDASICTDAKGLSTCYDKAKTSWTSCVNDNCAEGSQDCYEACDEDMSCMETQCPELGIDCINACACVQAIDQVDCIASSCWNQETVQVITNTCVKTDMDQLPFWPSPDDTSAGCSCNMAKTYKKELLITDQLSACSNNMTNLNQMSVDEMIEYTQACLCCAESAVVSTIYDTCPNAKPSLLAIDRWYDSFLEPNDWESCGDYLNAWDCAGELGFGSEDAGETKTFYKPGGLPKNGTETLSNTGSLSTPVSGVIFTWTFGTDIHVITAVSADNDVAAATTTDCQAQTGSATQTGATSTQIGMATARELPVWTALVFICLIGWMLI
ncbi:hypothetical protein N7520_002829 [Penicillium odoratum]|uniref:uncharacterized protein n=1 Tax=Penicillium odoratum TaxID=1167516 RepID=UPI002549793C|nr:uncharacterized protein N7520_002829 [Penicillium odoratum]KAJ5772300.1 hypothetical protein N7520_002829 [Penicillium odoratum]